MGEVDKKAESFLESQVVSLKLDAIDEQVLLVIDKEISFTDKQGKILVSIIEACKGLDKEIAEKIMDKVEDVFDSYRDSVVVATKDLSDLMDIFSQSGSQLEDLAQKLEDTIAEVNNKSDGLEES